MNREDRQKVEKVLAYLRHLLQEVGVGEDQSYTMAGTLDLAVKDWERLLKDMHSD